jgi:hypothetical protein
MNRVSPIATGFAIDFLPSSGYNLTLRLAKRSMVGVARLAQAINAISVLTSIFRLGAGTIEELQGHEELSLK